MDFLYNYFKRPEFKCENLKKEISYNKSGIHKDGLEVWNYPDYYNTYISFSSKTGQIGTLTGVNDEVTTCILKDVIKEIKKRNSEVKQVWEALVIMENSWKNVNGVKSVPLHSKEEFCELYKDQSKIFYMYRNGKGCQGGGYKLNI